jgi:hypothetical protein
MNRGHFSAQLNEIERILSEADLLNRRNHAPAYSRYSASDFRQLSYRAIWEKCLDEGVFDFVLSDGSLLQFRAVFNPLLANYTFYDCPLTPLVSLDEFRDQEVSARGEAASEYEILRDYELLSPSPKDAVLPLRYDYAPRMYTEGRHPASHVHFGHSTQVRVGTTIILRPVSFVLFVLRQMFPDKWDQLCQSPKATVLCRNVRETLDPVNADYLRPRDHLEMYLS